MFEVEELGDDLSLYMERLDCSKAELLCDQPDHESIEKVHHFGASILPNIPSTSQAAISVTDLPVDEEAEAIKERLEEIQELSKELPLEPSYFIKVQNMIALLLEQLNRISQKDRSQIDEMRKKFYKAAQDSSDQTMALGWSDFKFSVLGFTTSLFRLFPYRDDQFIGQALSEHLFPGLGKMFGADMQASIRKSDAVSNITLQQYSEKTSKGSSDSSNKQEILKLLDTALQSLREAARSNI